MMVRFVQELQRRTPLGWLQLKRHKGRLLIAVSGIAFADILMFMQLGFQSALFDSNTRLNQTILADIVLMNSQAKNTDNISTFPRRRLIDASDVPGVKATEPMYISMVTWRNPQTRKKAKVRAVGFNLEQPSLNIPEANAQVEKIMLPDSFLFDKKARGEYQQVFAQVEAEKEVTTEIDRRTITINGLFNFGASFTTDGLLISSTDNFLRLFPHQKASSLNLGLIYIESGYKSNQIATRLKEHLPEDVKVLTREEFVNFEKDYLIRESPIVFIFGFGVAMGFFIGVILVYQILSTDVNSHLHEYATFKAIGYSNIYLLKVVFEEAIIIAIVGYIPGFIIPVGLYQLAANATNLPIYMTMIRAIFVFIMTLLICLISGVIATHKLQSADPADLF
ncbi:DevC protein [Calothrix sp. NIES-4071]|nr:DevC protein [Calothrix sp. NIES-4071]BAZ54949.1 DevC protein [Calothrix sp. NIES-4105]